MRCSKCGAENREGRKFCAQCAAPLAVNCSRCGASNEPGERFCGECSAPLGASAATGSAKKASEPQIRLADTPAAENLDGERKTVTALFADIKGSTELEQNLDPEEARAIVDPALKLMIDAVRRYDGYIVQSTGDGIFAIFGAPVAHEDHPQRALHAALRMHNENRRYGEKLRAGGRAPLQIRVGINTGEVVVRSISTGEGKTEYTPIGHTANLASRIQTLANPNSTVVSETTRRLVEGYFTLRALGASAVKGIAEAVPIFEVTGIGPLRTRLQRSASRGYTKFVGREHELETIKHAAELAKSGRGQIVAAVAEPGVGKSRLFFEFKASSQNGWLVLDALALPHEAATAYAPLIDLLHVYFHIMPEDDVRTRREKVAGKVAMLDRSLEEETLPRLFALLSVVEGVDALAGMDEQIRQRRTQDAVRRILLRESLNQPLMLVFEDLHWIDDATQGFLNTLAEGVSNAPVLMLVNYRPEYTHQWSSQSFYTQLRLDPLGKESAAEMLSARIGDSPELAPLKRLVLERTEGNPLFIEELVEALFDEGVLVRNGTVKVAKALHQLKIPPTVQGILAARIDRLSPESKELLQTLAVIGSEFPFTLVRQVVQLPGERLEQLLDGLQSSEFIYEQPATGDIAYRFKHDLTREEAYKSLLTERRKLLHERTARAIETLYFRRLEDHYAELAHQYRSSDNAPKAIEYLLLAGGQAADRGAYAQSGANAELALKLIERLPEGVERLRAELGVRLMEGMTVTALYGMASTERLQIFERVCQLSESLGDVPSLFRGLLNSGFAHAHRFEALRALEIARRCVKLAEQELNEMIPAAYGLLSQTLHRSGDLLQAASAGRDAMKGFTSPHQGAAGLTPANLWGVGPVTLAAVELALGRPDEACKFEEEALRRARELKHAFSFASALHTSCLLRYQRQEPEAARELAESLIALAEEHGFREHLATGKGFRAWATTELDQTEATLTEFEALAASSQGFLLISKSMLLAKVYLRVGRAEDALGIISKELAGIERSGAYQEAAELHRLKGEAILMRDAAAAAEAEACFRKAIEVASDQSAKWWELRATTSLARLLRDTKRRDEARAMLADVYNWFTEGFDTVDLKDAKALLDELA
jgi:class 3 adenylate cyclase/tetratricopeptide (TPR) repeat protein